MQTHKSFGWIKMLCDGNLNVNFIYFIFQMNLFLLLMRLLDVPIQFQGKEISIYIRLHMVSNMVTKLKKVNIRIETNYIQIFVIYSKIL